MTAPDRAHRSATRTAGFTLAAATLVSLAGNVQHAVIASTPPVPLWFALGWAAVPPLALPLAVHLAGTLGRATAGRGRRVVVAGVMAAAALAFGVSFYALRDLTQLMGYPPPVAVAVPVLIDVLAALATLALLVLAPASTQAATPVATPAPAPVSAPEPALVAAPPAAVATALTCTGGDAVPVPAGRRGNGAGGRGGNGGRPDGYGGRAAGRGDRRPRRGAG